MIYIQRCLTCTDHDCTMCDSGAAILLLVIASFFACFLFNDFYPAGSVPFISYNHQMYMNSPIFFTE